MQNNIDTVAEELVASENIRAKKGAVVETPERKKPHEIFEYFVNQEMKVMFVEETNLYASHL